MASAQNPADANIARSPQNGLGRLTAWCYGHRPRVLLGWLLAVVAIIGLAQWAGSRLDNNFTLASSPSQQAQNLLASRFPSQKGLSRMREEWARRRGDNSKAVANGLAATARMITAAAAIMVCVLGSFVIGAPLWILGVFGLGLAAAVLVDATVVRMVLVPAVMRLLGPANWWLPRWIGGRPPTSPSSRTWILCGRPGLHPASQRRGRQVIRPIRAAGGVAAVESLCRRQ